MDDKVLELTKKHGVGSGNLVWVAEVGSTALGLGTGSDDFDAMAVYVEDWIEFVDANPRKQSRFIRTKPEGVRSEPGDIDIQMYSFRKFANLLSSSNPSILIGVHGVPFISNKFAARSIAKIAELSASKRACAAFMGYFTSQKQRWMGNRSKGVRREELISAHGYDTKYASHVIRLAIQGVEYLSTGSVSVPMEQGNIDIVMSIKNGDLDEAKALSLADKYQAELERAIDRCRLPNKPNFDEIKEEVAYFYWSWFLFREGESL